MAEQRMLDKLKALEIHYEDVQSRLADPAVYADRETLRSLSREEKELSPLIEVWRTLQERQRDLEAAQELSSEPGFSDERPGRDRCGPFRHRAVVGEDKTFAAAQGSQRCA